MSIWFLKKSSIQVNFGLSLLYGVRYGFSVILLKYYYFKIIWILVIKQPTSFSIYLRLFFYYLLIINMYSSLFFGLVILFCWFFFLFYTKYYNVLNMKYLYYSMIRIDFSHCSWKIFLEIIFVNVFHRKIKLECLFLTIPINTKSGSFIGITLYLSDNLERIDILGCWLFICNNMINLNVFTQYFVSLNFVLNFSLHLMSDAYI